MVEEQDIKFFTQIPSWVDELENISDFQARLIGYIYTFENVTGSAFPSNQRIAKRFSKSTKTVQTALSDLYNKGIIESSLVYKSDSKIIEKRYLKVTYRPTPENGGTLSSKSGIPYPQKRGEATPENGVDNKSFNKSINKLNNNKEQSNETPAQQMLNIFNKALGRNVANQGTFSGLVFKNVSVQEFEDVINYVMSWNDDILQNTTASTIARNFDKYSDKASELGYKDGKKPVKKTSNKGYNNKPQRVEPQMITEPVAESNVDASDVAKELAELKEMGLKTKLEE